jgi:membrane-associated protease RseP (regulator of RpoE activity)
MNDNDSRISRLFGPQRWWLHILLFVLTLFTTTVSGESWRGTQDIFDLSNLPSGLPYALLVLLFLSSHEFGHFIAARLHGVDATLPFYIPFPGAALGTINFGTFGAVIRTRSRVPNDRVMFDIGVAGPIAGFIACVIILAVGFLTLPGIEYLRQIHPAYPLEPQGALTLAFGKPILYSVMEHTLARPGAFVPPMSEMYHYPFLCAGWFGLFVTALNLLPIGQLDGGHLTYTMFGSSVHRRLGQLLVVLLLCISIPEILMDLSGAGYFSAPQWVNSIVLPGGSMWFVWALIGTFVIRFHHPPSLESLPLDSRRKVIGYLTIVIFVLCAVPSPIIVQ